MARKHPGHPPEFRRKIVELVRSGRNASEVARQYGISRQAIGHWVKQHDLESGPREEDLTKNERDELARLRRENKRLKMEQEILSKAAAWFAREANTIPESSDS